MNLEKLLENRYVISDTSKSKLSKTSYRIPYFYLHGRLEDLNGYDCVNASIETFYVAMRSGVFLVNAIIKAESYLSLCICDYSEGCMQGYIVMLDDLEGIKEALSINKFTSRSGYCDELAFIREKYPEVHKLLKESID